MADILQKLKSMELFKDYDERSLIELSQGLEFVRLDADTTLFEAGQPANFCYIISYGGIKMVKPSPKGRDVVMCFLHAGDIVAAGIMSNNPPIYPLTAVTQEDSGLIKIPRREYTEIWQNKPQLMRAVNQSLMSRMVDFQTDKALFLSSVPQKVASFLIRTLDHQPHSYGQTINLRLTRKDIADRVGTSGETVIRILSEWTQKGWITTTDQHISILDRQAVENILTER
ncbi:MAG: hypothetical protein BroJett040_02460 [Oligoflexia bacterium]|nr:MAG: hypothetical protein BroJett040_02460 [Oligoflexia bacterium]